MPGSAEEKAGKQISRITRVVVRGAGNMGRVVSLEAIGFLVEATGQILTVNG